MQFETIHPFLDGNGRIGQLLVALMLCHEKVLREPLLYSSLYIKQYRRQYYAELNLVRESGEFDRWLEFFCDRASRQRGAGCRHGETKFCRISGGPRSSEGSGPAGGREDRHNQ